MVSSSDHSVIELKELFWSSLVVGNQEFARIVCVVECCSPSFTLICDLEIRNFPTEYSTNTSVTSSKRSRPQVTAFFILSHLTSRTGRALSGILSARIGTGTCDACKRIGDLTHLAIEHPN